MALYLDASVIVAITVSEGRSDEAFALTRTQRERMTSDFGFAESCSAVARRIRTGQLADEDAMSAWRRLDQMRASWLPSLPLLPTDIATAEALIRRLDLKLRAPDAIHLAVAARLEATLLTFDAGLADAARVLNRPVLGA